MTSAAPNITRQRIALLRAGFAPIAVNGKAPVFDEWQKLTEVSADEIMSWSSLYDFALNTGCLTRYMPTVDIDIKIQKAAEAVEKMARERFGERGGILVRVGLAPKRAIPFRTEKPFAKITVNLTAPNGSTGQKIEFLGDGQQVVVAGIHPDTGKPYQWFGGEPGEFKHEDLPEITEAEAIVFVDDAVELLIGKFGYRLAARKNKTNGSDDASEDWGFLFDNIHRGVALHDSLRDLAAKMIVAGTNGGAVTTILRTSDGRVDRGARRALAGTLRRHPAGGADGGRKVRHGGGRANRPRRLGCRRRYRIAAAARLAARQCLLPRVHELVFAEGAGGKSAVRYAQALALATGRPITGEHVFVRSRVLIVSLEDSRDELRRRIHAARLYHKISAAEVKGWLFLSAPGGKAGKLMTSGPNGRPVRGLLADSIEAEIVAQTSIW